jgi:hypothetical protein
VRNEKLVAVEAATKQRLVKTEKTVWCSYSDLRGV